VRSSRAGIRNVPQQRRASVCGSAAGVALRLRFAMRSSPPSAPLSPLAEPQTEAERPQLRDTRTRQSAIDAFQIFQSVIEHLTSHLAGKDDSAMKSASIVCGVGRVKDATGRLKHHHSPLPFLL